MKLTTETKVHMLYDMIYFMLSNPKQFVFNDYKTYNTNGRQVFKVPEDMDMVIDQYWITKKMKDGDFLFSLKHNNKEAIAESSFSAKVKKFSKRVMVFQYIYEIYQHILGNHFVFLKSYGKTNKETRFKDVA